MKRIAFILGFVMIFTLPAVIFGGGFQVYPGARLEDNYEIKQPEVGGKVTKPLKVFVFTTNDPFESVVAFYRSIGREYRMPGSGGKPATLSSGQELKEAYFIFDNASDLSTSKHWVKIQRPYLGRDQMGAGFHGKSGATRDVTAIIEEDKRSYP